MNIRKIILTTCALTVSFVAGAQTMDTLTVRIPGMRCDDCAHKVMVALTDSAGAIGNIDFDLERRTATIPYDPQKTSPQRIEDILAATRRYKSKPYSPDEVIRRGIGIRLFEMTTAADADKAVAQLKGKAGIDSLAPHVDKGYLFVRYDANKTKKAVIKRALTDAGFTTVNYYTGDKVAFGYFKVDGSPRQDVIDNLIYTEGVEDVSYNPVLHTLGVTYFNNETTAEKLLADIRDSGLKAAPAR